jgi:hypothetical protein
VNLSCIARIYQWRSAVQERVALPWVGFRSWLCRFDKDVIRLRVENGKIVPR